MHSFCFPFKRTIPISVKAFPFSIADKDVESPTPPTFIRTQIKTHLPNPKISNSEPFFWVWNSREKEIRALKGKQRCAAVQAEFACCALVWYWWWFWWGFCLGLECSRMASTSSKIPWISVIRMFMDPIVVLLEDPSWVTLHLHLSRGVSLIPLVFLCNLFILFCSWFYFEFLVFRFGFFIAGNLGYWVSLQQLLLLLH